MIKIAIVGYGNLGKAVEAHLKNYPDLQCIGIFSRRDNLKTQIYPSFHYDELLNGEHDIDVCILCGSSDQDLMSQTQELSQYYNCIDSFDIHRLIPEHLDNVDKTSKRAKKTSIISVGWDPGLFSWQRLLFETITPIGTSETFWGKGVSQGHSNAILNVEGVKKAVQYTIPNTETLKKVQAGLSYDKEEKHERHCYVVADEKDHDRIKQDIITMPHYFAGTKTLVYFVSEEELKRNHHGKPHGGIVTRYGQTGDFNQTMSFNLDLEDNPSFTATVLIVCARAAFKMNKSKRFGAFTIFDLSLTDLSDKPRSTLIKDLL
ncbi:diaminopimelate dehydrogenase [Erysipelothrix urinaevulpis]|uniref:diaminopimelate dehydrogenase n=1 Tax=Erysipelothrix urinaevulpis TaxID=2683717 RepID=UPI00135ABBD8|nr:diaminopimelate dehydrogenase [Erysipelothrix urinaevulpis]